MIEVLLSIVVATVALSPSLLPLMSTVGGNEVSASVADDMIDDDVDDENNDNISLGRAVRQGLSNLIAAIHEQFGATVSDAHIRSAILEEVDISIRPPPPNIEEEESPPPQDHVCGPFDILPPIADAFDRVPYTCGSGGTGDNNIVYDGDINNPLHITHDSLIAALVEHSETYPINCAAAQPNRIMGNDDRTLFSRWGPKFCRILGLDPPNSLNQTNEEPAVSPSLVINDFKNCRFRTGENECAEQDFIDKLRAPTTICKLLFV